MWDDVIIVGVTAAIKEGKRPCILIHGRNDCNDRRVWSCFANTRDRTVDGETEKSYYWSGGLQLALGATVGKMEADFDAYLTAVKKQDKDAVGEARSRLHEACESGAKLFTTVQESLDSDNLDEARESGRKVADRLSELLGGHILRVDWDETAQYPSPARHMLAIKRSLLDGSETFGAESREVSVWIEEFAQGGPKSFDESLEETLDALENDEEHDRELAEMRNSKKPTSSSKKKTSKKTTSKKKEKEKEKETVPSTDSEDGVPF